MNMSSKEMEKSPSLAPSPTRAPLQFQAVTPGLGFHPFSDGLPYAPVSKVAMQPAPANRPATVPALGMGAGATSAGPASFQFPVSHPTPTRPAATLNRPAPARRVSVPVANAKA